jgi:hypothetical protein
VAVVKGTLPGASLHDLSNAGYTAQTQVAAAGRRSHCHPFKVVQELQMCASSGLISKISTDIVRHSQCSSQAVTPSFGTLWGSNFFTCASVANLNKQEVCRCEHRPAVVAMCGPYKERDRALQRSYLRPYSPLPARMMRISFTLPFASR